MFLEGPMDPLTKKQWKRYEKASRCHIFFKPFNLKDPKVRDHCPYTGRYRGPAHLVMQFEVLNPVLHSSGVP